MKTRAIGGASVRERKAEALDTLVKAELAKKRAATDAKMSALKALRLTRDAEQPDDVTPAEQGKVKSFARKTVRRSAS